MSEVRLKTLSRKLPGIYLCGELLDVTGRLGGYNFSGGSAAASQDRPPLSADSASPAPAPW